MNIYKLILTKMYIYYFNAIAQKQIIDNSFFLQIKKAYCQFMVFIFI